MFLSFPQNNFYVKTGILKTMQSWPDFPPKCHRKCWNPLLLWLASDTYRLWKLYNCTNFHMNQNQMQCPEKRLKGWNDLVCESWASLRVGIRCCSPSLLPRSTEELAVSFMHCGSNHDRSDATGSHATGWDVARILPSVTVCRPKLEILWRLSPVYCPEFHVKTLSCSILSTSFQSAFLYGF